MIIFDYARYGGRNSKHNREMRKVMRINCEILCTRVTSTMISFFGRNYRDGGN